MRHAQEKYRPPPSVHAFDQMMTASRAINKPPRRKDQEASRFTGDALEGVVNVWLQYTYRFCILRLYPFAACAFCAAVGATKDKEALKTHHILLPVCRDCIIIGKLPPKRNPIKSYRDFTLREMNPRRSLCPIMLVLFPFYMYQQKTIYHPPKNKIFYLPTYPHLTW